MATKRTYDEIFQPQKKTTFTNKTNKGRNVEKNPDVLVHSKNIQERRGASANKNKETDSEVAKAQTELSDINKDTNNSVESQSKATKKPKMSGKSVPIRERLP